MCGEDASAGWSGNNGFKDMVMALKWVQENICKFNGDPSNVLIFGESAGGAATHLLTLSPMAKGNNRNIILLFTLHLLHLRLLQVITYKYI